LSFVLAAAILEPRKTSGQAMSLSVGDRLGRYEILGPLGAGGMGEVYRARDTELERDVAVKVLPEAVAQNPDRLARFEREAKAVAKLSHPNILDIHDYGREGEVTYSVTELLEGDTLRERLEGGTLGWSKAIEIGAAIADGLAAAHGKGVVHRDLKPENIFITNDGRVKILDFGLARVQQEVSPEAETDALTPADTEVGTIMGTVGYMAPEQVKGQPADARSDIFALGCVLYEMVAGQRAFARDTAVETMNAILKEEPADISTSGEALPSELAGSVRRCLEKKPQSRFQSASDLAYNLRSISTDHAVPVAALSQASDARRPRAVWAVAVVSLAVVAALAVLLGKGIFEGPITDTDDLNIRSLAVLPLQNLSGDPEQEFFADGMTEALITSLAKVGAIKVISRTSVMRYKGTSHSIPEIARELNVDGIVEGSVFRADDQVRITVQLIEAATDQHIWAESYERELREVLSLQNEVARAIINDVKGALTPEEQSRLATARPVDPDAYEAYLKGRYHWNKFTVEGVNKAIEYFEQAIEEDSSYASAYAGLADSYNALGGEAGSLPPKEAAPKVREAALRALEIDDTLAEAHAAMAHAKLRFDWDWAGAERDFRRAIELNPNSATSHHLYSYFLTCMGRLDEAISEMGVALELDPLALLPNSALGWYYLLGHRFEEAIIQTERAIELDPNSSLPHLNLGMIYIRKSRYDEAMATLQRARTLDPDNPWVIPDLARCYAVTGRSGEASELVHELEALSERRYVSPGVMAWLYAGLGHKDEAFEWLETAFEERSWELVQLKLDTHLDPLRDDPRFNDLVRRMKFPDY
jgi:serine/threonine protein kinase/tetratricopeptide (TPR) repeat protein